MNWLLAEIKRLLILKRFHPAIHFIWTWEVVKQNNKIKEIEMIW